MSNLNLLYYKDKRGAGYGNFGDELSCIILKHLCNKYKININLILNPLVNSNCKINLCFIGSLISAVNLKYNNLYILGSGIRRDKDRINKNNNMKIYSVRGPLSKNYLEQFGYCVPNIFGDPALLITQFYKPNKISTCNNKIGIVGHLDNYHKYDNIPNNFILINPTWRWDNVIDHIFSCNLILSSSLHGLIVADAYKIPNIWLDEYPLNEGHFKFKDYFSSQNRKIVSINNINHYKNVECYKEGNIIDLNKIESCFINMCSELNIN